MENIDKLKLIERLDQVSGSVFCQWERLDDGSRKITFISKNIHKYLKVSAKDIINDPGRLFDNVLAKYISGLIELEEISYQNLSMLDYELEYQNRRGQTVWLNLRAMPEKNKSGVVMWSGIITDITYRKNQEYKQLKVNHELKMLSLLNDIVLNSAHESTLLDKVCFNLVNYGGYELVWISRKLQVSDDQILINPVSFSGNTDYLNEVLADIERENFMKGPTVMAHKSGKVVMTNDVENSEDLSAWLLIARKHHISSSLVIPFVIGQDNYTINICSKKVRAFDDHEVSIFMRMLWNITSAVANLRDRDEKKIYHFELKERVKELRAIYSIYQVLHRETDIRKVFESVVRLIPKGWQYPDHCVARLTYNNVTYSSGQCEENVDMMAENFFLNDMTRGSIEVSYTKKFATMDEGPFLDEERELLRNICSAITITLNKTKAVNALALSESRLKSVFENIDAGSILLDLDFRVEMFNTAVTNGFDFWMAQPIAIGRSFFDLLMPEKKQNFMHIANMVIDERRKFEYETSYYHEGEFLHFSVIVIPVMNHHDEITNINICARDITMRKRMELSQEKMSQDLISRNRDLEQFSYMVSHNLRAPLVNIIGLSEVIGEDMDSDDLKFTVRGLRKSAHRLDKVVSDLNTVLTVKNRGVQTKTAISLEEMVTGLHKRVKREGKGKHRISMDFSQLNDIYAVPECMENVLYNLIANIIEKNGHETVADIRIWTVKRDDYYELHVAESSTRTDIERPEDIVLSAGNNMRRRAKGKRVDLFMVKSQVFLMGGDIHIRSEFNSSSEFVMKFPLDEHTIKLQ